MSDVTQCVLCTATPDGEDGWTAWVLAEDIRWRSAFAQDGTLPSTPAGRYLACPACSAWIPRHRAGNMPARLQEAVHTIVSQKMHPQTRRAVHAELVGQIRHLGAQLQLEAQP